jgi:hypothetical protein
LFLWNDYFNLPLSWHVDNRSLLEQDERKYYISDEMKENNYFSEENFGLVNAVESAAGQKQTKVMIFLNAATDNMKKILKRWFFFLKKQSAKGKATLDAVVKFKKIYSCFKLAEKGFRPKRVSRSK